MLKKRVLASLAIAVSLLLLVSGLVQASSVEITLFQAFEGNVMINGSPAPVGTEIKAMAEGVILGADKGNPVVTNLTGKYGQTSTNKLVVQGLHNGDVITFYINGVKADQTAAFASLEITTLDLSATIEETSGSGGGGGSSGGGSGGDDETTPTAQCSKSDLDNNHGRGKPRSDDDICCVQPDGYSAGTDDAKCGVNLYRPPKQNREPGQIASVTTTTASTQAAQSG
jgi:hypothetical protein